MLLADQEEELGARGDDSDQAGGSGTAPATNEIPLTAREVEVVRLLVDGFTNGEIGAALGISERTVQSHVASARGKLHARSRTHLAALVLRRRIVPLGD